MRYATPAALVLAATLTACLAEEDPEARYDPTTFTAADEEAIAKAIEREQYRDETLSLVAPEAGTFTDGAYDYMRPLLRSLTEQPVVSRRDSFGWDVRIVLDDAHHAYTLPGGRIVLFSGLLYELRDEAEFVGLLAREVALAEQGAAMAALDRQVHDNTTLGDMIVGAPVPLDDVIAGLPELTYTAEEVRRADSLVAELICSTAYDPLAWGQAIKRLRDDTRYHRARPLDGGGPPPWAPAWGQRVAECAGDSLYATRYRAELEAHVPQ